MRRATCAAVSLFVVMARADAVAAEGSGHAGVLALIVDPKTTSTLFAALGVLRVFKSRDSGAHWVAMNDELPARVREDEPNAPGFPPGEPLWVTALAIDPQRPKRVYAGTNCGVYKSADGGARWKPASQGLECVYITALAVDPHVPSTLYAGTSFAPDGHGLYKSRNRGRRWRRLETDLSTQGISAVAIDPAQHRTVYEGNRDFRMAKTVDGGRQWSYTEGLPAYGIVSSLVVAPDHTVYLGLAAAGSAHIVSGTGVFKSMDRGETWTDTTSGLSTSSVLALAIDPMNPGTVYAGTEERGVFKSENAGMSWSPASNGLTGAYGDGTLCAGSTRCVWVNTLAVDPKRSGRLYAGTDFGLDYSIPGRVFASNDGASSWTETSSGLPQ